MPRKPKKCKDCGICTVFADFGRCHFGGNECALVGLENRACKKFVPKQVDK